LCLYADPIPELGTPDNVESHIDLAHLVDGGFSQFVSQCLRQLAVLRSVGFLVFAEPVFILGE
jgi:hypothetical protein